MKGGSLREERSLAQPRPTWQVRKKSEVNDTNHPVLSVTVEPRKLFGFTFGSQWGSSESAVLIDRTYDEVECKPCVRMSCAPGWDVHSTQDVVAFGISYHPQGL